MPNTNGQLIATQASAFLFTWENAKLHDEVFALECNDLARRQGSSLADLAAEATNFTGQVVLRCRNGNIQLEDFRVNWVVSAVTAALGLGCRSLTRTVGRCWNWVAPWSTMRGGCWTVRMQRVCSRGDPFSAPWN